MNNNITIFKDIKDISTPHFTNVECALKRISDGKSRSIVEQIRKLSSDKKNKGEVNLLKQKLPCVCFSGIFTKRNILDLKSYSRFIVLDIDDVENVQEIKQKYSKNRYVFSTWISPSGNGLKVLVKVSSDNHLGHFLSLSKYHPEIDMSGKDVSRVCYESYDPEIYINKDSEVFDEIVEQHKDQSTSIQSIPFVSTNNTYDLLKKWLHKQGCHYYEGNRNKYLSRLVAACLRFGIQKSETEYLISSDYLSQDSSFTKSEFTTMLNSTYRNLESKFATAEFKNEEVVEKDTKKNIPQSVFDISIPSKDIIHADDILKDIWEDFRNGTSKGNTTYFNSIDQHFRWMKGETTCIGGIGNYGKSSILMQLCLLKSKFSGDKWAVFSPEQNPPIYFYKELIRSYIGKPVDIWNKEHKMTDDEFKQGLDFVKEHFFFIYPKDNSPTPEYILERFLETIIKKKVTGCIIDPFNTLANDWRKNGRDDQYLDITLGSFKRFAMDNNVYFTVIAHPQKLIKDKDGNYPCPDVYDLAGGAMWNNKMDNILAFHRPFYQTNKEDTMCEFRSQKIKKQMLNGIPGTITLDYNRNTGRYFENGISPFDYNANTPIVVPEKNYNPNRDIEPNKEDDINPF